METGIISPDNLALVLRSVSQKRRHGILELALADRLIQVHFVTGKIVDVSDSLSNSAHELASNLKKAGFLADLPEISTQSQLYAVFAKQFQEGFADTASIFKLAVEQRVLQRLYDLRKVSGAMFAFKPQVVEADQFAPAISVGQLLLDMVALEEDAQRFRETFPQEQRLVSDTDLAEVDSLAEKCLLRAIHKYSQIKQLAAGSLLAQYAYQEGLLSLQQRGLIAVSSEQEHVVLDGAIKLDAIVAALEDSIDQVFGEQLGSLDELPPPSAFEVAYQEAEKTGFRQKAPQPTKVTTSPTEAQQNLKKQPKIAAQEAVEDPAEVEAGNEWPFWQMLNVKLLQSSWVPELLAITFVVLSLMLPMLIWGHIVVKFSQF